LKSARLEHGLLINFGSYKFEMRKFAWPQDGACRKNRQTFLLAALSALQQSKFFACCGELFLPTRFKASTGFALLIRPQAAR
jgi:hypothetical protein